MKKARLRQSGLGSSIGRKLALLTGGGAAALASHPSDVQATIVASPSLPLSSPIISYPSYNVRLINWDIDGDSKADFRLVGGGVARVTNTGSGHSYKGRNMALLINGNTSLPEANLVLNSAASKGVAKLGLGDFIGATLAAGYKFAKPGNGNTLTKASNPGPDVVAPGWSRGDTGYFGFNFLNAAGTHYGWAEISFGATKGSGFTINQAYYNDVAGESILVGQTVAVPEPSSLALLALGAAGLAFWRRRHRAARDTPSSTHQSTTY